MSDKPLPFVITDRRKFTSDGEARPDADPSPEREARVTTSPAHAAAQPENLAHTVTPSPEPATKAGAPGLASETWAGSPSQPAVPTNADPIAFTAPAPASGTTTDSSQPAPDLDLPPAPTPEQMEQSKRAFDATADRLDIAIRSANPGADHPPAMTFEALVQSVYMQAILQLGGATPEGQQPQIDILGARQSVDMLAILADKTANNLSPAESNLLASALFELRLAFLEITQSLARSAQQRATAAPPPPGTPTGPRIVR